MSDDGNQWCKSGGHDSYTLLPIHLESAPTRRVRRACNGDRWGAHLVPTIHRQRRSRLTRDISFVRRTCSDDSEELISTHNHTSSSHSSSLKRLRLINVCLIVLIHLICNEFVSSVSGDELLDAPGARGHFTHTWAVHIPGGAEVAQQVADDHGMHFRGMVSNFFCNLQKQRNFY